MFPCLVTIDCLWYFAFGEVHKSFTKKFLGYEELSYKERLSKSGLKSLELIRLHGDLIYCYKILHKLVMIDNSIMFDFDPYCGPRSHGLSLRAPKPRTDLALHSFNYRVCFVWNSLSANTLWEPTLASFKSYLFSEDLSHSLTLDVDTLSCTNNCFLVNFNFTQCCSLTYCTMLEAQWNYLL